MQRDVLVSYLDELLQPENVQDYGPNGLQVAGAETINRVITGVTACQALLDQAVDAKAQAVLVHHGYFWRGESPCIVGMKRQRVATLINHDINLLAYHLPLDVHPTLGNNVQLARVLGISVQARLTVDGTEGLVCVGELPQALSAEQFADQIDERLARPPLLISGGEHLVKRIAWCTGGAQRLLESIDLTGIDAYLTGEASEQTVHFAREMGVHFYAAGHHATERYGIQAVTAELQAQGVEATFFDVANPV